MGNISKAKTFSILIQQNPDFQKSVSEIKIGLQKSVDDVQGWLDHKRMNFPRLFFVSDEELLDLVAHAKDAKILEKHLPKYFSFSKISMVERKKLVYITSFESSDGENVPLSTSVLISGLGVDEWLLNLELAMQNSLKQILKQNHDLIKCLTSYQASKLISGDLLQKTPGQVLHLLLNVVRTAEIAQTVTVRHTHTLAYVVESCNNHISDIVVLLKNAGISIYTRNILKTLVSTEIMYRDWSEEMISKNVNNQKCSTWNKQLKYYLEYSEHDAMSLLVKQNTETAVYAFEYLGTSPRIFWSSASQTIYSTIWGSLQLHMGIVTYGPESVDKSEIVKDFVRSIGRFSSYFNCSNVVSTDILTRLLVGMAMTGCILILTHIDLLQDPHINFVLNALSSLRDSVNRGDGTLPYFLGRQVKIPTNSLSAAICSVSTESAAKTGFFEKFRTEMRIVSVEMPNILAWTQACLAAGGFDDAGRLGEKLSRLFRMSQDQLSKQAHYDFSLRTMKTVLILAESYFKDATHDSVVELNAILYAINAYISPKLYHDDCLIFNDLVTLIFSSNLPSPAVNEKLQTQITDIGFEYHKELVSNTINQFVHMMRHDQHIIILGATGVGKSSLIQSASKILCSKTHFINPAGMPQNCLFGNDKAMLLEKGVLETVLESPTEGFSAKWLVFTGSLESKWTDGISSLFERDVGGALCFPSGKRLFLPLKTNILIEADTLRDSSAGFIGRFNIVNLSQKWSWRTRLEGWFSEFQSTWDSKISTVSFDFIRSETKLCCYRFMQPLMDFVSASRPRCSNIVLFNTFLSLYETIHFQRYSLNRIHNERQLLSARSLVEDIFHYCLIWTLGMSIPVGFRSEFSNLFAKLFSVHQSSSQLKQILVQTHSVFELSFDFISGAWLGMQQPGMETSCRGSFIISQREKIAGMLIDFQKNVVFLGPAGTGKSSSGSSLICKFSRERKNISSIDFSCIKKSGVSDLTIALTASLSSQGADEYFQPTSGGHLLVFLDDLNLAEAFDCDSASLLEFVRHLVDHKGFWASQRYQNVRNFSLVGSYDQNAKNQITLNDSFLRHFAVLISDEQDTLELIAEGYLADHLFLCSNLEDSSIAQLKIRSLKKAGLELVMALNKHIQSTPVKPFHLFSPRDLRKLYSIFLVEDLKTFCSTKPFMYLWIMETRKIFRDRLAFGEAAVYDDLFAMVTRQTFDFDDREILNQVITGSFHASKYYLSRETKREETFHLRLSLVASKMNYHHLDLKYLNGNFHAFERTSSLFDAITQSQDAHAIVASAGRLDISADLIKHSVCYAGYDMRHLSFTGEFQPCIWIDSVKKLLRDVLGSNGKRIVCCISVDRQTGMPVSFFSDLNCLLSGAKENMWWTEKDYEALRATLLLEIEELPDDSKGIPSRIPLGVQSQGCKDHFAISNLWKQRVRENLSIVLCIDLHDQDMFQNLAKFPRISSFCYTTIHQQTSKEQLTKVALVYLQDILSGTQWIHMKDTLSTLLPTIYLESRNSTPGEDTEGVNIHKFLSYVEFSAKRIVDSHGNLERNIRDDSACLEQMLIVKSRMKETVDQERSSISAMPAEITKLSLDISNLKKRIISNREQHMLISNSISNRIESEFKETMELESTKLEGSFKEAIAAYEKDIIALSSIKKNNLEELKQFSEPTFDLEIISRAICILHDRPPVWAETRKLFSSHTFLEKSSAIKPESISEKKLASLQFVIDINPSDFVRTAKARPACKTLYFWIRSTLRLCKVMLMRLADLMAEFVPLQGATPIEVELLKRLDNEEKGMHERLRKIEEQHRNTVGKFSVFQILKDDSVFRQRVPDTVSECQWIQEAFKEESKTALYDEEVANAHQVYQQQLKCLETLKGNLSKEFEDSHDTLNNLRDLLDSLAVQGLDELKTATDEFGRAARSKLLELYGDERATSQMIAEWVYFDNLGKRN